MDDLTGPQERALRSLCRVLERDDSPSLRDWAQEDGRGVMAMYEHRKRLQAAGYVDHIPRRARSLKLTEKGREFAAAIQP